MGIFSKKTEDASQQQVRQTFSEELRGNEIADLRSRARRRLLGAVVIAMVAFIVLPLIFDREPASEIRNAPIALNVDSGTTGTEQNTAVVAVAPATSTPVAVPSQTTSAPVTAAPPVAPPQTAAVPPPVATPTPSSPAPANSSVPPANNRATPANATATAAAAAPTPVAPATPTNPANTPPSPTPTTPAAQAKPPVVSPPPANPQATAPTAPATTPPATTSPAATNDVTKRYRVQFGAYSSKDAADAVRARLLIEASMNTRIDAAPNGVYRVRSEQSYDKAGAESVMQLMRSRNINIATSLVAM